MKQLEIEELQAHLLDVLGEVQEGETIEVTSQGNVVAMLVPALPDAAERRAALAGHNALATEIGKHMTEPTTIDTIKDGQVPDIMERRAALARLDALADEIGKHLTEPIDITEVLAEIRRY